MTIERPYPHLAFPELILWNGKIYPAINARHVPVNRLSSDTFRLIILQSVNTEMRGEKTPIVSDELLIATTDILLQRIEQHDTETLQMFDMHDLRRFAEFILSHADTTPAGPPA